MTKPQRPLICVDFDGTLVADKWPMFGDYEPDAIKYIQKLLVDNDVIIHSARLNNHDMYGTLRTKEEVTQEVKAMRTYLDLYGLREVKIWAGEDCKPSAALFIDDRAIRYDGSWRDVYKEAVKRLATE